MYESLYIFVLNKLLKNTLNVKLSHIFLFIYDNCLITVILVLYKRMSVFT